MHQRGCHGCHGGLHRHFVEAHADNPFVSGLLLLCGVTILAALLLTLFGLPGSRG